MVAEERILTDAKTETVHDSGAVVVLDGHAGWGQAIGREATDIAEERARRYGVACVLARNTGHVGRVGEHTARLADAGCAGIMIVSFQGGDQQLAPHGGVDRRLTNNPISFAAPGGDGPTVLLDMALSVIAGGKVMLALARGEQLPEGAIIDADGNPSTDPADFFSGGRIGGGLLLPIGGHKGYGVIVLAEIFAGLLSGGGTVRAGGPERSSNAFCLFAIDVAPLAERARYAEEVGALRSWIKSSRPRDGVTEIFLPGEPEHATAERRQSKGIAIEQPTWDALAELGRSLGVEQPAR
jgi:LDH2 family malate/lactate/ureidoglycolate dehydrogenase